MNTMIDRSINPGVSWPGAFAGLVLGLALYVALSMLGVAIGGSLFGPGALKELAWGALGWMALSAAISAFVAGFSAARMSPWLASRRAGLNTGLLTGVILLLSLSFFAFSSLSAVVGAALSGAQTVVGGAAQAVGNVAQNARPAAQALGIDDDIQAFTRGFDRGEFEQYIAQSLPQLNQPQVRSVVNVVFTTLDQARDRVVQSFSNPTQIDDTIRQQSDFISSQLRGPQFVQRLTQEGLSTPQAQEVANVVGSRVDQIQTQLRDTTNTIKAKVSQTAESAAHGLSRAAWGWLLIALVVVGLSTLGGRSGASDLPPDDQPLDRPEYRIPVHH